MNKPDILRPASPAELEATIATLAAATKRVADKIPGKSAVSLAYWGTAHRLLTQLKAELEAIREG